MKKLSENGLNLIKKHEGLRLKAYRCPARVYTIGYGHTGKDVKEGMVITTEDANELLKHDVQSTENAINRLNLAINNNQFDALVSLVFNIGITAFTNSSLLKCIKANPASSNINYEWLRWTKAAGSTLPGLVSRRKEELALYFR
jgi:lysozyme